MTSSVAYCVLLPVGASDFPEAFKVKVADPLNIGVVFARCEFIVDWAAAF